MKHCSLNWHNSQDTLSNSLIEGRKREDEMDLDGVDRIPFNIASRFIHQYLRKPSNVLEALMLR